MRKTEKTSAAGLAIDRFIQRGEVHQQRNLMHELAGLLIHLFQVHTRNHTVLDLRKNMVPDLIKFYRVNGLDAGLTSDQRFDLIQFLKMKSRIAAKQVNQVIAQADFDQFAQQINQLLDLTEEYLNWSQVDDKLYSDGDPVIINATTQPYDEQASLRFRVVGAQLKSGEVGYRLEKRTMTETDKHDQSMLKLRAAAKIMLYYDINGMFPGQSPDWTDVDLAIINKTYTDYLGVTHDLNWSDEVQIDEFIYRLKYYWIDFTSELGNENPLQEVDK